MGSLIRQNTNLVPEKLSVSPGRKVDEQFSVTGAVTDVHPGGCRGTQPRKGTNHNRPELRAEE